MIEKNACKRYNNIMIDIIINSNKHSIKAGEKLKDILTSEGLPFPCGGKGICGKCRINCPQLAPTDLDKRFLSENQIKDGMRLACDKKAEQGIDISFEKQMNVIPKRKMEFCNIAVIIDNQNITLGILDEEIVEKVVIQNTNQNTIGLRSAIAKECIELFEKYNLAKADTIAVGTTAYYAEMLIGEKTEGDGERFDALELMLPAETLYMLPFVSDTIGGDFLALTGNKSFPRMIIDASKTFVAGLFQDKDIFCISHKNIEYTDNELIGLQASIQLLLSRIDCPPIISLYGDYAERMSKILLEYSYAIEEDSGLEVVARTTNENKLKNVLFKLRKRVSVLETVNNDEWQEQFILAANNRDY